MSYYSSLVDAGNQGNDDDQFDKDVQMALELSRISAAEENIRRHRLSQLLVTADIGNSMSNSHSAPNMSNGLPVEGSAKVVKAPAQAPTPLPRRNANSEYRKPASEGVTVRPRPRPSSTGRSVSPSTLSVRRSGFVESVDGDKLTLPSPRASSPWDATPTSASPGVNDPVAGRMYHGTLWENIGESSGNAHNTENPFFNNPPTTKSPFNPFENSVDTFISQAAAPSAINPFDSPVLNVKATITPFAPESELLEEEEVKRSRADSDSNLIALSPLSKDRINKHYKIDLDSLFSSNRNSGGGPVLAPSPQNVPRVVSDATGQNTAAWLSTASSSLAPHRANSPAHMQPQGGATAAPQTTRFSTNELSPRTSVAASKRQSSAFTDLEDVFLNSGDAYMEQSLQMPTTIAPGLPQQPPPLPARNTTARSTSKTSLQIKRVSTPQTDLLDLQQGIKIPEISSVQLFDPLFSPSDEMKRGFEEQFTNLNEKLSAQPVYTVATVTEDDEDGNLQLQDPFSYEELSMALMTTKMLGEYELVDEKDELVDDRIQSEESNIYETIEFSPEVPKRPFKPRSLSVSSHKNLRISDNETMDEFTAFSVMVARLKADYKYDDKYTNLGILFSPTVSSSTPDGLAVDITVYTEMASEPIQFRTDVTTSVEIIIWNVMSNISGDFLEVSVDDYILKVFNYSEFLVNDSNLCDYAYTHKCLKLNESIKFSLHVVASLHKPFLRKPGDDEEPIYMIKDELHGDKSYKVQPRDLKLLYDVFTKHSESVNTVAIEKGLGKLNITSLLQSVKAITSVLLGDETLEIKLAIKQLKRTLEEVENSICDEGKFMELMDDFQKAMESLTAGIRNLLTMYCATFRVRYIHPDISCKARGVKEVKDSPENVLVQVGSVHRIPVNIRSKFDHFKVIVSLYYAGQKVCDHISTKVYSTLEDDRSTGTIYFDQWLELTDFPSCLVPSETRVTFTLCAMNTSQPLSSSGNNTINKWINIGWVSFMFFDFRRNVTQGNKLLSLWQGVPNVTGATGSNIWQPNTTLLQINLPDFGFELKFPPALPQASKSVDGKEEPILLDGDEAELNCILSKEEGDMTKEDKEFMWSNRANLWNRTDTLHKVLLSAPQFNHTGIQAIQDTLDSWAPLSALEALRLLLPDFPCQQIRNYAVKCLKSVSSDEMCDYLPQLVQALKYENYHDSELVRLLLERCITSVKLAQQLYWTLKEGASQPAYRERYKLLFGGLVSVMGKSLREEMEREELLVRHCHSVAEKVKQSKGDSREKVMGKEVLVVSDLLSTDTLRLPTNPGYEVDGLNAKLCTYFNSFTLPLKLVFKSVETSAPNHYLMYKVGDDLRQDMIVMQLINIMDKLWLQNDLDLKLVTFTCLPTGDKRGMVELISECETLGKIQGLSGITGSFKDQPLANWLQKHNPTHTDYQRAVENFTLSCAGYCVATYILGIGDRHNDNIMVKRSGHIFHIDFSKFLGNAQMFGNFKRDRTPFILTKDMAYVINGSDKQSQGFQDFIDLCCEAFNTIREQADGLLTLLKLMTSSGIKGLTPEAVRYVRTALLPDQTKSEATVSFTRMIEESLQSKFVQWNFFIHNLAQLKFSSHSDGELLSFIPTSYSMATDGRIINVEIFDYQKRIKPEKHYIYIIKVHREKQKDSALVYRRYSECQEFYSKLVSLFPLAHIPRLPGSVVLGRTHVQKVAEKRKAELETFLRELLMQAKEISEHDLLYTFFHPMLRDETETVSTDATASTGNALRPNIRTIKGEVKLSIQYKQNALHIMVMHVKELANESGDRPNPYVKMYLLPDPVKTTKRKTKVMRSTFHPTYNEMFEYRLPMREIRQRTLQVTVYSAELTGNNFLGAIHINLFDTDFTKEWIEWHKLSALHCIKS